MVPIVVAFLVGAGGHVAGTLLLNVANCHLASTMRWQAADRGGDQPKDLRVPLALLTRSLTWRPNNSSGYRALGRAYLGAGAYEQATRTLERAVELLPDPLSVQVLGEAYWAAGQEEAALACWGQAAGTLGHYRVECGVAAFRQGRAEEAERGLRLALQIGNLSPTDELRACRFLGGLCHDRGVRLGVESLLDEAIEYQKRAIEIAPNQGELHEALALTLLHAGRNDEAIDAAREAVALSPDLAAAHRTLASALAEKGLLEAATREYGWSLSLAPDDPWAHYGLGAACWRAGLTSEAVREWQKALEVAPDFEPALRALGRAESVQP